MKINTTIIASILLVTLIAGCAYGDRNLGMNTETGPEAESAGVFERFMNLAADNPVDIGTTRILLNNHPDLMASTYTLGDDCYGALHYVAIQGSLDLAEELLTRGAPIDMPTGDKGRTSLMVAIREGNLDVGRKLINQGANMYAKDQEDADALHYAARSGKLLVFKEMETTMQNQRGPYAPKQSKHGFNLGSGKLYVLN